MQEYPLLIFPEPSRAGRAKRHGGGGKIRMPAPQDQAGRITPQFQRLQQAMDRQRVALQDNALGLQPEQALVLETIGPVDNFIKAVKKVEGLEWLGEFELEDLEPEYGFEDDNNPDKKLDGQLFLVMTDQRALVELQRLFSAWQQDPTATFPRGLAPWKHAFAHLRTIRPWDAQDRIRETGLFEDWQFRLQHEQQVVPFEAELWFRGSPDRRQQAKTYVQSLIESLGGEVVQQCVIPEIAYHGILGRIPRDVAPLIIEQREVHLLQCEDVMHLRPVGQCAMRLPEDLSGVDPLESEQPLGFPSGNPVVALLDGLPLAGHRLLDGRLIVDDPDGYENNYQARERVHGTAMASLICHGDLDANEEPTSAPVYVRPIMQPNHGFDGQFFEQIPDNILPVDIVHRAVRRLYEGEGDEPPVGSSVRVINLSICDRSRPFDRGMSSWARLLDWLSWRYNVLFVVSAGNHAQDIELAIPRTDLQILSDQDREKEVIKALAADTRHRRLLSPAETFNGLTVGAIHDDASSPSQNPHIIDPFARTGLPSIISAQGPGFRRTIKPDIFLSGGRQFVTEKMGNSHSQATLQAAMFTRPPGQRVATPGVSGELNRTYHSRGTSNSAALATRSAVSLLEVLNNLRSQTTDSLPTEYDVVLLKALLVHGADWGTAKPVYESILRNTQNNRTYTDYVGRFLGYGSVNVGKVMICTDQRVTVLGVGELQDEEAHEFQFPWPPSLSAVTDKRRLTVTLAWISPINSARQGYRVAHLWFDPKNNLAPSRENADHRAVTRGTVQHEILEGERAVPFQDGEQFVIRVNCRSDAGDIIEPIRYGLAVTLEVAEGINIPIYAEVRDRLRVRVPLIGRNAP